ncbi:MAG: hypothetical protein KDJ43_02190 [Rhizobiaceae bacterium]|nr:hypothetical protein [Rhizobiaceae bacterium]
MRRWVKILAVLGALVVAGNLAWCVAYPRYEWRQKITVEVETPQGLVSASSVAEIAWWGVPKILPEATPRDWSVNAEAVVVPLPDGKYLFALVRTAHLIARAVLFDPPYGGDPYLKPASQMKPFKGEAHAVQPENYPLLVTFDDIDDPTTVKRVDPDDLAASFGHGVSLKRITLEITDEPVTKGEVEKMLGWLGPHLETTLGKSPSIFDPVFAATVTHGDFRRRPL